MSRSPLLPLSPLALCAVMLAGAPVLAQPASPPRAPVPLAPGQLVFGILGQPLHGAPDGVVTGAVHGAPALLLEEGPTAKDGRRWFRVLTAALAQGWLPLAANTVRTPAELRATSGSTCSPDDAACLANDEGTLRWEGPQPLTFLGASRKPRCQSAEPCLQETPWLKLGDGTRQGWVDARDVTLTWEPVDGAPAGRECATHLAFGLQGLVRGPFLTREEWKELSALVQVPSQSLGVEDPVSTVLLNKNRGLTVLSKACRRQEFDVPDSRLVDLAGFECITPGTCEHALLVQGLYRSGHSRGSTLFIVSGQTFQLPHVEAQELSGSGAEGENAYQADAVWWVEPAPQDTGAVVWIVQATKEHVEEGKARSPKVGVRQLTVGPVAGHPDHPAHPTPRAFQAILLAEGPNRDSLTAQVAPVEACLGRRVPRFELLRNGRWLWAAGRLFETTQEGAAWKAAVHRCGMKKGFTFASLPNVSR